MTKEVMHTKAAAIEQLSFSASAGQTRSRIYAVRSTRISGKWKPFWA